MLRAAGLVECFHINRHLLGLDSCVVLSAKYSCADGTFPTKEQLFPALRKVIETHAALGVKLEEEDSKKPSFVRLETIQLPLVVRFSDNDNLEAAIQAQLARSFNTLAPLPLWRVEVLSDGTILLAFHHSIGDGLSGVAFHQSLLAALQQELIVGDDSLLISVPQSLTLSPPIETLTNLRPSLRKVLTEIFYMFAPASWTPAYSAWTANPVPQIPELKPHVKLLTFSSAEMTAFAAACRSHSATVTSALYILTTSTLSRLVPPDVPQYKTLSAHVAISLRGAGSLPAAAMGDYASGHHSYPPLHAAFNWAAAADYARELQRQKLAAREEAGMLMLLFGDIAGFMRGRLGRKRGGTFEISNAGRVAVAGAGRWRIGRMAFAQCDVVIGAALKLNVIGDPTGAVSVTLTWGEGSIDRPLVESFAAQFEEGLRTLIV
ncbi:alcohol acetyltransferase [Mycena rosella]|uniref:Alcohol acetyltransferase n=1 Tax=Mycena rosella TaxID=1033263 RepID=A0AAD7DTY3_MYCRO|nr:alcohol acetyltransferase [Mycena rosella]